MNIAEFFHDFADGRMEDWLRRPSIAKGCVDNKEPGWRLARQAEANAGVASAYQGCPIEHRLRIWIHTFRPGAAAAPKRAARSGHLSAGRGAVGGRFHRRRGPPDGCGHLVPLQLCCALFAACAAAHGSGIGHTPVRGAGCKNPAPASPRSDGEHGAAVRVLGNTAACRATNASGRPGGSGVGGRRDNIVRTA